VKDSVPGLVGFRNQRLSVYICVELAVLMVYGEVFGGVIASRRNEAKAQLIDARG